MSARNFVVPSIYVKIKTRVSCRTPTLLYINLGPGAHNLIKNGLYHAISDSNNRAANSVAEDVFMSCGTTASGADSIGHGGTCSSPHRGHREWNSKQQTDQTVLTTTKAFTKTTDFAFGAKTVEGHRQKNSNSFRRRWPQRSVNMSLTASDARNLLACLLIYLWAYTTNVANVHRKTLQIDNFMLKKSLCEYDYIGLRSVVLLQGGQWPRPSKIVVGWATMHLVQPIGLLL